MIKCINTKSLAEARDFDQLLEMARQRKRREGEMGRVSEGVRE